MMNAPVRRLKQPYRSVGSTFGRRIPSAARWSYRPDPARRLLATMLICGAVAIGLYVGPYLPGSLSRVVERLPYADTLVGWLPANRREGSPSILRPSEGGAMTARAMPICGGEYRADCVVDGDTIWVNHEKIRLETIDAPEVHGRCSYETDLAARATRRLHALLSGKRMTIVRSGHDIYGRTLARISTDQGEVGVILANEGLARRWTGQREPWC